MVCVVCPLAIFLLLFFFSFLTLASFFLFFISSPRSPHVFVFFASIFQVRVAPVRLRRPSRSCSTLPWWLVTGRRMWTVSRTSSSSQTRSWRPLETPAPTETTTPVALLEPSSLPSPVITSHAFPFLPFAFCFCFLLLLQDHPLKCLLSHLCWY